MLNLIVMRLHTTLATATNVERTILSERLWHEHPRTLDDIGQQFGVTRERVRQKQTDVKNRVMASLGEEGQVIAGQLEAKLEEIAQIADVERFMEDLAPYMSQDIRRVLVNALIELLPYKLDGQALISNDVLSYVPEIIKTAKENADEVGIVAKSALTAVFPADVFERHWHWFRDQCRFYELYGFIALRNTRKANVKAAIMSLNRPATRPELAEICGLTNKVTSATLSSMTQVVRVSRTHWALKKWGLREYDGIVTEILKRIEQDGGSTSVKRLIDDFRTEFNVKKISVQAFMHTSKFHIENGMIRVANPEDVPMRPLNEVVDGHDFRGLPYWTFPVVPRYFRGFSVVGLPVEIASYLGCPADGSASLQIRNLPGCRDLTIQWHLASTTNASIGYLRDALQRLNLQADETARMTLVERGVVELTRHTAT